MFTCTPISYMINLSECILKRTVFLKCNVFFTTPQGYFVQYLLIYILLLRSVLMITNNWIILFEFLQKIFKAKKKKDIQFPSSKIANDLNIMSKFWKLQIWNATKLICSTRACSHDLVFLFCLPQLEQHPLSQPIGILTHRMCTFHKQNL